ncbi:MAG TPA: HepT-like ribonuclease domain-containing protein [Daejeonella sp.]|nr:HepT-like ribonuclease domain-containing protein [Daejeonella sp.]
MDNNLKLWLYNILNAILEIENFFDDQSKDFAKYQTDLRMKRAVKRNMGIIGETLNKVLQADQTLKISHSEEIAEIRNRIIAYDSVSDEMIWEIITKRFPVLKAEIESLLRDK